MNIPTDALAILTPALVTVLITALGMIGAWLRMKTRQWEKMTEDVMKSAEIAKEMSAGNRILLEENRDLSRSIEANSNGMNAELRSIAAATAFRAGKIKGKLENSGAFDDDELEKMEADFMKSIQVASIVDAGEKKPDDS